MANDNIMFPISEYFNQGMGLAKYCLTGRPVLPTLMLYVTDACNSRCRICHLWQVKKHSHLSLEAIRGILRSPLLAKSVIGLEGGEFFLHPEWREILELLSKRGRFMLLSNGLMPQRLIESVKRFKIPKVLVSCDGLGEAYSQVRGVDGFPAVKESILSSRGYTDISAVFTFGPWNSIRDFRQVREFCRQNKVNLKVNIFHNVPLFGINETQGPVPGLEDIDMGFPEKDYLALYNGWLKKKVKLPCMSIRFRSVVWPDGSVPLCQGKDILLGNIHNQSIDEIWNSPKTRQLWKEYYSCNDCWMAFHRIYEVALIKAMEKLFPLWLIKRIFGGYALDG